VRICTPGGRGAANSASSSVVQVCGTGAIANGRREKFAVAESVGKGMEGMQCTAGAGRKWAAALACEALAACAHDVRTCADMDT
jgi:hypothetical protein